MRDLPVVRARDEMRWGDTSTASGAELEPDAEPAPGGKLVAARHPRAAPLCLHVAGDLGVDVWRNHDLSVRLRGDATNQRHDQRTAITP
jgi:hypothetical protein